MDRTISTPDVTNTLQIRRFHVEVVEPSWCYETHHHCSFELLHCIDGHVTEWVENQPIAFRTGDWLLIPPGVKHSTVNPYHSTFTYLSFEFDIDDCEFRRELNTLARSVVTNLEAAQTHLPQYLTELDNLICDYLVSTRNPGSSGTMSMQNKLQLQILSLCIVRDVVAVLEQYHSSIRVGNPVSPYEFDTANHVEQLLLQSLNSPDISVERISKQAGLSRNQCTKLFTRVYGMSPRQYITSRRLLQAKDKLIHTNQSIDSIARELGFSSLSHFSRQFKAWTGLSPLRYRPKYQVHANPPDVTEPRNFTEIWQDSNKVP